MLLKGTIVLKLTSLCVCSVCVVVCMFVCFWRRGGRGCFCFVFLYSHAGVCVVVFQGQPRPKIEKKKLHVDVEANSRFLLPR